jgi:hypothetical protein
LTPCLGAGEAAAGKAATAAAAKLLLPRISCYCTIKLELVSYARHKYVNKIINLIALCLTSPNNYNKQIKPKEKEQRSLPRPRTIYVRQKKDP